MPSTTVLIINPKGNTGNRTSLNRARRYVKKGKAEWIKEDSSMRFIEGGTSAHAGPRSMWPAQFIITPEMKRSIDLRAALPMWPTIQEVKDRK